MNAGTIFRRNYCLPSPPVPSQYPFPPPAVRAPLLFRFSVLFAGIADHLAAAPLSVRHHAPYLKLVSFFFFPLSFQQESFFQWCFGVEEPGCYGAVDVGTGASILFVPRLPPEYAIWEGKLHTLDDFTERYGVDETRYTDEIARVLKEKRAHLLLTLVSLAWEQTDARSLLSCLFSHQVGESAQPGIRQESLVGKYARYPVFRVFLFDPAREMPSPRSSLFASPGELNARSDRRVTALAKRQVLKSHEYATLVICVFSLNLIFANTAKKQVCLSLLYITRCLSMSGQRIEIQIESRGGFEVEHLPSCASMRACIRVCVCVCVFVCVSQ